MKRLRSSGTVGIIDPSGATDVLQQINDLIRSIQSDTSQIIVDYNREIYPVLNSLSQGREDTRWSLNDDSVNPRINGLDGANIFVDTDATSISDGGRFWYSTATVSRPKTIKESLSAIYTEILEAIDDLRDEIAALDDADNLNVYNTSATDSNLVDDNVSSLVFDGTTISAISIGSGKVSVSVSGLGNALHDDVAGEIAAITTKASPTTSDYILIEDAADSNNKKKVTIGTIPGVVNVFQTEAVEDIIQPIAVDAARSFVVGSQTMEDSGATGDNRMFYDQANGSFRAGIVNSTQWDSASRGDYSVGLGKNTTASGDGSFVCGLSSTATGNYSHAEGASSDATGASSHAEGVNATASDTGSHAEGANCTASGGAAHAEGSATTASGANSHSEGGGTVASASGAHAEGASTTASGLGSHAEGSTTTASGDYSHAAGIGSVSRLEGGQAHSSGYFSVAGDGQAINLTAGVETTDATWTEITLDYTGATPDVAIPATGVWGFSIQIVGKVAGAGGNAYFSIIEGAAKNDGANITLIGAASPLAPRLNYADAGAATWDTRVSTSAGDDLAIEVQGQAATTIHWVASVRVTEVIL